MPITNAQVSVGTTATALNTAGSGSTLYLSNPAGQTVYLGDASVTTSNGCGLPASTTLSFELAPGEVLYGIVAATTATLGVLRS